MDIFAGSDEVVRFEPVGPEDEAAAQQETDYVNHVFMQQNPGFMILYSFIKDALLSSRDCRGGVAWHQGHARQMIHVSLLVIALLDFISGAGGSLLGSEAGRRAIWRGGRGILGALEGHFREGNREGEAMPQIDRGGRWRRHRNGIARSFWITA